MGDPFPYPTQTIPGLPPAGALLGDEEVWVNQAGVDARTTLSDIVEISFLAGASTTVPLIDVAWGAVGVGLTWARADHAHPMPRLDQILPPANIVSMNGYSLIGVATPVSPTDAATKAYVDALIQGMVLKPNANLATTAGLPANTYNNGSAGSGATLTATANGLLSVDGFATASGQIILVKNEANAANNGLYDVTQPGSASTPYILTRNASMNQAAEISGALVSILQGTANANGLWLANPTAPVTIGTTLIPWTQLNAQTALQAGLGISIAANTVSAVAYNGISVTASGIGAVGVAGQIRVTAAGIGIDPAYVGQASITTVGAIATGTWTAGAVTAPSVTGATPTAVLDSFVIDAGTF
jgi:hypothetical protein